MHSPTRLFDLLSRWDALRQEGKDVSPASLCRSDPELLTVLQEHVRALVAMAPYVEDERVTVCSGAPPATARLEDTVPNAPTPAAPTHRPDGQTRYVTARFHKAGGLGQVHVAHDVELGRVVALKSIRPQHSHHPESRLRFEREAALTARLAHPGIVPVHGLVRDREGNPSYAMRFVEGESLAEAIERFHQGPGPDAFQSLTLRKLLQAFVAVCNTIGYAHSQGIIHRDLKPGNVMLGAYGETLVVDWGLAKDLRGAVEVPAALDAAADTAASTGSLTELTRAGRSMGTLAFASPEQAAGRWDEVGPASDVYGLGASLYSLLTGQAPHRGTSLADAMHQVEHGTWQRPTTIRRDVPRALEAIVLQAMALRPDERYASALELAADVERWLADEPVRCHPEPVHVRAGRWLRKHRTLVAGMAALLVTSVLALTVGLIAVEGERQHTATERDQKKDALLALEQEQQKTATALASERHARAQAMGALRQLTDGVVERQLARRSALSEDERRFLREIKGHYEALTNVAGEDDAQRAFRAEGHGRVGRLQLQLGEAAEAEASMRKAVDLFRQACHEAPDRLEHQNGLADNLSNLAALLVAGGQHPDAEALFLEALAIRQRVADGARDEADYTLALATAHNNLAHLLHLQRRMPEAEAGFRQALQLVDGVSTRSSGDVALIKRRAGSHNNLGLLLQHTGRFDEAKEHYTRALALQTQLVEASPDDPDHHVEQARYQNNLGFLAQTQRDWAGAEAAFAAALSLQRDLAADYPAVPAYRQELARTHTNVGRLLRDRSRVADAEKSFRQALALRQRLADDFPRHPAYRMELALTTNSLGLLLMNAQRLPEAEEAYNTARRLNEQLVAEVPHVPDHRNDLATCMSNLAILAKSRRDFHAALALLHEAGEHNQVALAASPKNQDYVTTRRNLLYTLTQAHAGLGNLETSLAQAQRIGELGAHPMASIGNAFDVACTLASCLPIVAQDTTLDSAQLAERKRFYVDQALAALRAAIDQGFRDVKRLHESTQLESLRHLEEFQKLRAELQKQVEKRERLERTKKPEALAKGCGCYTLRWRFRL